MPVSIPINLEDYARPISLEAPSGVNLRDDPTAAATWSTIRDFRDEARRTERRADDGGDDSSWRSAVPTWAKARDLSLGLLRDKTHDLAVAAVLTEALLRTDGFAGLAAGFDIARTMIQSQWDSLFPAPDPEDGPADERILPLTRLIGIDTDGLLIAAILNAPLTDGHSCDPLGLGHHRISASLQGAADSRSPEADRGGKVVTPEQFKTAVLESQKDFLADVYGDLNRDGRPPNRSLHQPLCRVPGSPQIGCPGENRGDRERVHPAPSGHRCGTPGKRPSPSSCPNGKPPPCIRRHHQRRCRPSSCPGGGVLRKE
jgi:type VI secretion system ImpA family protein